MESIYLQMTQTAAVWALCAYRFLAALDPSDWVVAFATLLSPFFAVQAQMYIERRRGEKRQKLAVFETLWTTRREFTSPEHKKALNLIDIVFIRDRKVIKAWRRYFAELSLNLSDGDRASREEFRISLFAALLRRMGQKVGFNFSDVIITQGHYSPIALGYKDYVDNQIREGLLAIVQGGKPINMTTSLQVDPEAVKAQVGLQKKMAASISDTGGLKVISARGRTVTYRKGWK